MPSLLCIVRPQQVDRVGQRRGLGHFCRRAVELAGNLRGEGADGEEKKEGRSKRRGHAHVYCSQELASDVRKQRRSSRFDC